MLGAILTDIWREKGAFFFVFFLVVALTYAALFAVGFVPEPKEEAAEAAPAASQKNEAPPAALMPPAPPADPTPDRIIIDALGREVSVNNPQSRDIEALDAALSSGVVRHPSSADLLSNGTMFLFGHSSYLPQVLNRNYQAFNGIEDLSWGDTVRVQSATHEYLYRVDRVYEVAASVAQVEIVHGAPKLTLVTCNNFGAKEDRFVVEATLVGETLLPASLAALDR